MKPNAFLKNALSVFLPACMLLTGCTAPTQETAFHPKLDSAYAIQAEMEYGEQEHAVLTLTRSGSGQWDAEFSEPNALAGVLLTFDGNAVSASYKGLAFTVPKTALPAKNMLTLTTGILDSFDGLEQLPCTQQEDGTWCSSGECEGGSYTIIFADSGEPAAMELPNQPLKLTFSGYTVSSVPDDDPESVTTTGSDIPAETTTSVTESTASETTC